MNRREIFQNLQLLLFYFSTNKTLAPFELLQIDNLKNRTDSDKVLGWRKTLAAFIALLGLAFCNPVLETNVREGEAPKFYLDLLLVFQSTASRVGHWTILKEESMNLR